MVVFDMAGTTVNEDNLVYKCLHKAMQSHQIDLTLDQVLLHAAGKEKKNAIIDLYADTMLETPDPTLTEAIYEDFIRMLHEAYENYDMQLMEDTRKILYYLQKKGIKRVLNTGYDQITAKKILNNVNLLSDRDIDLLVTADMVALPRPAPDMIEYALRYFNVAANECIKVGDSIVDIEEGKNAKVKYSIGITTGAQNRETLESAAPHFIIDSLFELRDIIEPVI
ncbi:MAG: HAD hydrolase-like protein [Saprospiraceae bacterium]|nr:HAD hydrolase-like protein [Saprospiraceae bacterium]